MRKMSNLVTAILLTTLLTISAVYSLGKCLIFYYSIISNSAKYLHSVHWT